MADIAGSYNSNQSFNPKFVYTISYSQTGRSATAATYNFTVNMTRTNGSYGYDIKINWNIGGVTGNKTILAVNSGAATASTTFSVTVPTNASGGTLSARIYTSSTTDGTHSQNAMDTGNQTVNKSTFNTAPTLSGSVTADGTTGSKYIAENKSSIAVSWPAATDPNNNISGYRVRVSINGGGWTELGRTNSSTRSYSHTVSGYGEGTSFRYAVDAYDSYSVWSEVIYSGTLTKNTFTGSSITTSGSIGFNTTSISFTVGASSNTDGSGTSGRYITCNGVSVHNNTIGTGTITVTIYKSGTTPTGPYVKFDDIKNTLSGKNYMGTFSFNVLSTNAYGTNRTSSVSVWIDLRTNPNNTPNVTIAKDSKSTAYRTVTATGNSYFIPDGSRTIYVSWGAGSGKLGEAVKYQVFVSIGGGSWTLLSDRQTGLNYTYTPSKLNAASTIKFKIRTVTPYDYYSDADSVAENLHYYNSPGLTYTTLTRTATGATVPVTIKSASSIPNINTVGTWACYTKGTTTKVSEDDLTTAQTVQNIVVTGLTENGQYDLKVTYRDNTGFSTDVIATIPIGANTPIFFVNQYGIGVGGAKASTTYKLNILGNGYIAGSFTSTGTITGATVNATTINVSGNLGVSGNTNVTGAVNATGGLGVSGVGTIKGDSTTTRLISSRVFEAPALELRSVGGTPYVDFSNDASIDFDARIILSEDSILKIEGARLDVSGYGVRAEGWVTTVGNVGWYSETHGGGWSMTDTTWIRSYGGKNVYCDKIIRADGGLQVGENTNVVSQGSNTNGNWVRYYDGTQICYVYRTVSMAISNAYGSMFQNTDTWAFPVTFVSEPIVNVGRCRWGTSASWGTMSERTTTGCTVRGMDVASRAAGNTTQEIMAIGRWK